MKTDKIIPYSSEEMLRLELAAKRFGSVSAAFKYLQVTLEDSSEVPTEVSISLRSQLSDMYDEYFSYYKKILFNRGE